MTVQALAAERAHLAGLLDAIQRCVYFLEASRAVLEGPYDVALVEGSITTPGDLERIREVRAASKYLIAIGACATAGGIQALRNFGDVDAFVAAVYPHPEYIETLKRSTPIGEHVFVDFELRGCPVSKLQLLEVIGAILNGRKPNIPLYSVCMECKLRGATCVMVAQGIPCLGPLTQAGCGALCPAYNRGCYGCFGPMETPNPGALMAWWRGQLSVQDEDIVRSLRSFNAFAEPFRKESEMHEHTHHQDHSG